MPSPTSRLLRAVLLALGLAAGYADSSALVDFSFLRDPPAPGFLRAGPGGFLWEDGSRARFWGVNVANRNLWVERGEVDRMVGALARSGVNLVRFEALDSRGGILERPDGQSGTRTLDPEKLDTLHYWIHRLREKRIHYYLDLIDFREFSAEDGVDNPAALGRAARPYAVFDPRLVELQKEYATQLLTARNPYTGLAPVDDPFLALVEVCNESGFFLYPRETDNLAEPFRARLEDRWNRWLEARHPSREALEQAWGEALPPGPVRLPRLAVPDSGPRQDEGVAFLQEVQRAYFREMRDHLRSLGLRIPVTASVSGDVAADLDTVAAELDFTTGNWYWDHPAFGGVDWEGRPFHHDLNPAGQGSFGRVAARLRRPGKPLVIREWAAVWPNRSRAAALPEVAASGSALDVDGALLFSYKTGDALAQFGSQADPTVWGLFGAGATAFTRGDFTSPPAPAEGLLRAASPRSCAVAGVFPPGERLAAGALEVATFTPRGAVVALSLDGEPLDRSARFLVQMVSVAENTGQELVAAPAGSPNPLVLEDPGTAPVRTLARRGPATVVWLGGREQVRLPLVNGTWELLVEEGGVRFRCDLPGLEAEVRGRGLRTDGTVQSL